MPKQKASKAKAKPPTPPAPSDPSDPSQPGPAWQCRANPFGPEKFGRLSYSSFWGDGMLSIA